MIFLSIVLAQAWSLDCNQTKAECDNIKEEVSSQLAKENNNKTDTKETKGQRKYEEPFVHVPRQEDEIEKGGLEPKLIYSSKLVDQFERTTEEPYQNGRNITQNQNDDTQQTYDWLIEDKQNHTHMQLSWEKSTEEKLNKTMINIKKKNHENNISADESTSTKQKRDVWPVHVDEERSSLGHLQVWFVISWVTLTSRTGNQLVYTRLRGPHLLDLF